MNTSYDTSRKWPPPSEVRELKFRPCLFSLFIKRKIRHFHIKVVYKGQRNETKSVMHLRSCCCCCCFLLIKPIVSLFVCFFVCVCVFVLYCLWRSRPAVASLDLKGSLRSNDATATRMSGNDRFHKQDNNFVRVSQFFCTFLCRFFTTRTFYGERKQATASFLGGGNLDMVPWNWSSAVSPLFDIVSK